MEQAASNMPTWVDYSKGVESIALAIAILVGGVWALLRFRTFRETAPNADFRVSGHHIVRTARGLAMFVNVLLANRARTPLDILKVEYQWHPVLPHTSLPPPREDYCGPKPLIAEAQRIEPGKEAWGVLILDLPDEVRGAILWTILSPRRVGFAKVLAKAWSMLPTKEYAEPELTEWAFFIPAESPPIEGGKEMEIEFFTDKGAVLDLMGAATIGPPNLTRRQGGPHLQLCSSWGRKAP